MSNHRAGHARDHCMRIPIHVLGPRIGLSVPGSRAFSKRDGFDEVVALVDGLAVGDGGQSVEQRDTQPPSVGVGSVRVKGLSQPIGCDMEQQAVRHLVHSAMKPFLVNLKRVVTEVHSVRDDQVDHRVQMAVEHASVDAENSEAFFEQSMR